MDRARNTRIGIWLMVACGLSFAFSGPLAKSLMTAGWSPGATVLARVAGAALILLVMAALLDWRGLLSAGRHARTIVAYGAVSLTGVQATFFLALEHLHVAVALMIQAMAPIVVIGWEWARGHRPSPLTLAGTVVALGGATLVIDLFSTHGVSVVGIGWALASMLCNAGFFLLSQRVTDSLSPVVLLGAGMTVATALIGGLVGLGMFTVTVTTHPVVLSGHALPVWVSLTGQAVVATVIAYLCGVAGGSRIGSTLMSLVLLCEVLFGVILSWWLLGETITWLQIFGGVTVLAGIALAKVGDTAPETPVTAEEHALVG